MLLNMKRSILLPAIVFCLLFTRTEAQTDAWTNPALPLDVRVHDLISRLTPEEKVYQMMNSTPAIPRLHIPEYDWWNEALHGVARSGISTIFPQPIGMAATFDDSLVHQVADAISDEARAMYNASVKKDYQIQWVDVLDAEHQYLPRSAVGEGTGDIRRRPVSHVADGRGIGPGLAGR
jgi:beta-glucosidase